MKSIGIGSFFRPLMKVINSENRCLTTAAPIAARGEWEGGDGAGDVGRAERAAGWAFVKGRGPRRVG